MPPIKEMTNMINKFHNVYDLNAPEVDEFMTLDELYEQEMEINLTALECEEHEIEMMIDDAEEFLETERKSFEDLINHEPMEA